MKLTVFIPTYNGKDKLRQLLSGLQVQTEKEFSVHVLVDGGTDDTKSLQHAFPGYQFHVYANSGRAAIRNRAMEICKEGIILFLDHDMLPEKDLIATHKAFHVATADTILVGNGFRNPADATDDFSKYLVAAEKRWIDRHPGEFQVRRSDFVFTACNLSMPVALFVKMNGFNAALKDGEDFEFGMRALNSGVNICYDRKALAWHNDWPTLSQYIRRNSEYLAGKKVLVKMNPEFEKYLKVNVIENPSGGFKQFAQKMLGRAAMKNSLLFRLLPDGMKFIAFRSAIYQNQKL